MDQMSIIPASVAAEVSGAGSFFGSCQIASGNFEEFLQSACKIPITQQEFETASKMLEATGKMLFAENGETFSEAVSEFSKNHKSNEVLAQLQVILGEEAGAKAFETITNFIKKHEFFTQDGNVDSNTDSESSEAMQILSNLMKFIDPKYIAETPIETQKAELESYLEEIKAILGYEQIAQPETETPQPVMEIMQPETETPQPELAIEIPQLKTETPQPVTEIPQPKTETPQPVTEMPQPKTETPQPVTEMPQPKTEITQPELAIETPQPKTETPQPVTEMPQPETKITQTKMKTEQTETEEEKSPPVNLVKLYFLTMLGIKSPEEDEFYEFIDDLLKQGLIDSDDFDLDVFVNPHFEALRVIEEKKGLNFLEETLKELWECVKNGDEPKKEEILSMLRQITDAKEMAKKLKEVLNTEQKAEIPGKENFTDLSSRTSKKDDESELAKLEPVKNKLNKQGEEKQVQPEVRAVWEGSNLKIELINPKTGEKLHSSPVTGNMLKMQERINEFEVIRQVVAQAKFITTPTGEQRFTIQLRPEHLGQLDLRIILNHSEMQVHARVESPTAQQALENHIGFLREGLEKQGITLERLEVSVEQKDRQDAWSLEERREQQEQKRGSRRHHRGRESHLAISVAKDANADTGRRLGYNTMEYLA